MPAGTSLSGRRARLAQGVYLLGLAMLLVLSEVFRSSLQSSLPVFSRLARMALTGGGAALLLVKCFVLTSYRDLRQMALTAIALGYAAFASWYGGEPWFFLFVLAGLAAKDVDLRSAVRVYLAAAAGGLLLVQLLHFTTPLIPYKMYGRNWDFGYGHYNGYGARLLGVFFAWVWLRFPRLRWWDWAGLAALFGYTMAVPGSRGAGIAMLLLLLLLALHRFAGRLFDTRAFRAAALAAPPVLAEFSLFAAWRFRADRPGATPLLARLDRLLSGRFEVWNHMLFHTPLLHEGWTEVCEGRGLYWSLLGGFVTDGDSHHAIDNVYLALPMNKGLLGAALVMAAVLVLLRRLCRRRCTGELLCLLALFCYLLMENKPFLIAAHPFFLLAPLLLDAQAPVCPAASPRRAEP